MKPAVVAALVFGTLAIAGGAYYLHGERRCANLEEDYINSVSSIIQADRTAIALGRESSIAKAMADIAENDRKSIDRTMAQLLENCGERSLDTAHRKASQEVLGGL